MTFQLTNPSPIMSIRMPNVGVSCWMTFGTFKRARNLRFIKHVNSARNACSLKGWIRSPWKSPFVRSNTASLPSKSPRTWLPAMPIMAAAPQPLLACCMSMARLILGTPYPSYPRPHQPFKPRGSSVRRITLGHIPHHPQTKSRWCRPVTPYGILWRRH